MTQEMREKIEALIAAVQSFGDGKGVVRREERERLGDLARQALLALKEDTGEGHDPFDCPLTLGEPSGLWVRDEPHPGEVYCSNFVAQQGETPYLFKARVLKEVSERAQIYGTDRVRLMEEIPLKFSVKAELK